MRCITLHQPWASLVALGAKRVETRSWKTSYRGPLAIHAAKGFPPYARETVYTEPFQSILKAAGLIKVGVLLDKQGCLSLAFESWLPHGAILCTCNLVDCVPTDQFRVCLREDIPHHRERDSRWQWISHEEGMFGDYSEGRFGWLLEDIEPLPEPIPARGFQQLWETDLL